MRIVTLVENTSMQKGYRKKHGLCFYIETTHHKVLFDLGPDDTFLYNARKLDVDIEAVDIVIISHGHRDHGGALGLFFQHNDKAKIYVQKHAFSPTYAKVAGVNIPIGLDETLKENDRIIFVEDTCAIDDELFIFSDVAGNFPSKSNSTLYASHGKGCLRDDFRHEQNLLVMEEKTVLFTGCSHRGILNIYQSAVKHCHKITTANITMAIGGFHLFNPSTKKVEPVAVIKEVANQLEKEDVKFYTCHCTGKEAFSVMQEIMGEKLAYISAGQEITSNESVF